MPKASIIIRAKNEARFIGETLEAIANQRERDHEVIVVDSGSTDGTLDIARRFGATILEIKPEEFTYGYALNLGMREARGEYLISLSAHSTPVDEGWLGAAIAGFSDPLVAGVYGREVPRADASLADWFGAWISGTLSTTPNRLTSGMGFSNRNGAVRRSVWLNVPFDERLPGAEDLAWARTIHHLGYAITYRPAMAVYHSHRESLPKLLRRLRQDQPVILRIALGFYDRPELNRFRVRRPQAERS
jgi:rhamnosyltransferase